MFTRLGALIAAVFFAAIPAKAQIDDAKRLLLEAGYEDSFGNPGPSSPYAFLYLNRPDIAGKGSAFRLALAPVYADAELGLPNVLPRTDLGLGLSGGGYAYGFYQMNRGDEKTGESFVGHGGGPSVSLYPRFGNIGPVPVSGVVRVAFVSTDYQRTKRTDPNFEPPPDELNGIGRVGVRAGGVEPGLDHGQALEVSLWAETRLRDRPASYGYNGDRYVRRNVNLYWGRIYVSLPAPGNNRVSGGLNMGGGGGLGRLSAYRLGGMQSQISEFPLMLPGYFNQEISASRFVHLWGHSALSIAGSKRFFLSLTAALASVSPMRGTDAGGIHHVGLSAGISYAPTNGPVHMDLDYGYAPTALRGKRRGGQMVAVSAEYDFLGTDETADTPVRTKQQGMRWLFGP